MADEDKKNIASPIQKLMELYPLTRLETRRSQYPQTCDPKIRCREVEKDCEFQVSAWEVYWANIHANSEAIGSAVSCRVYGAAFRPSGHL